MARTRSYIDDVAYGEAHRHALPELYGRVGHRIDMADRDWTEFCHWCKQPIAIIETVRDNGQDLYDKGVSATRNLAAMCDLPAFLAAWRINRPKHVQAEIDRLGAQLMRMMAEHPIVEFKVITINRWRTERREIRVYEPAEWWHEILLLHRSHHAKCAAAQDGEIPVKNGELQKAQDKSQLYVPPQLHLFR